MDLSQHSPLCMVDGGAAINIISEEKCCSLAPNIHQKRLSENRTANDHLMLCVGWVLFDFTTSMLTEKVSAYVTYWWWQRELLTAVDRR